MNSNSGKQPTSFLGVPFSVWMRALAPSAASDRLLKELANIGATLLMKGGKLDGIDQELLRELGSILVAVASGRPADRMFRQNEKTKPRRTNGFEIAFVYHYMRACSENSKDDSAALEQVRTAKSLDAPKSPASVRKLAQKYRDEVLETFESRGHAELGDMMIRFTSNAQQLECVICAATGKGSEKQQRDGEQILNYWKGYELTPKKKAAWRKYLLETKLPHMRD